MNILFKAHPLASLRSLAVVLAGEGFRVDPDDATLDAPAPELALVVAPDALSAVDDVASLRALRPGVFIVVAADQDDLAGRLECYAAGADDCLFKPFHFAELVAKLNAFRGRLTRSPAAPLSSASAATVDGSALELRMADRVSGLTRREADLLILLARADGAPVRREDILRDAWKAPSWMTNNSVDVYVGYARRKLALLDADVTIETVRGVGFQIVERADARRAGKM